MFTTSSYLRQKQDINVIYCSKGMHGIMKVSKTLVSEVGVYYGVKLINLAGSNKAAFNNTMKSFFSWELIPS